MSLIVSEYICPVHGRFTATVEREPNGDPPAEAKCERWLTEAETKALGHTWSGYSTLFCGKWSPWTISAPIGRVKLGEALTRGKSDPCPPGYLDTRALGEGQPLDEWKAERREKQRQERLREAKEVIE